jgi:hypothetical protein
MIEYTILSLISICGLWVLLFKFIRDLQVDRFRQALFDLRDSLFDFAADGSIAFDHPAYGKLRMTINGLIRYGHRISLLQYACHSLFNRSCFQHAGHVYAREWENVTADLAEPTRRELKLFRRKMNLLVIEHMVKNSPLLTGTVIVPMIIGALLSIFADYLLERLKSSLDATESAAYMLADEAKAAA